MLNCYSCDKQILSISKEGKMTAEGNCVVHALDYRMIDAHLSNCKQIMAYATPVCARCLADLLRDSDEEAKENFKKRVISENKKYNCGPMDFLEDDLKLVNLLDMTEDLIREGIITCQ